MATTNPNAQDYWAAGDTRTCADEVVKRCDDYWEFCMSKGWMTLWRRLYYAYNPNRYSLGQTIQTGESNEYRTIRVNHFRNLLEHIQNLAITDRPAWQPQSVNSDSTSQKQTIIAESILDYYMREKRVERHLRDATRNSLLFGEGFVSTTWEPTIGAAVSRDMDTGREIREGDLRYFSHEPVDIVRDPNLKHWSQRSWIVVRTYENKYELAERFPEYRDEITSTPHNISAKNHYLGGQFVDRSADSDLIPVLTFYHVRSESVPDGRQMIMLSDGTVLTDTILLYAHVPVHRVSPGDQVGTPMGQTVSFDLLPLQEMLDAHYTAFLSINENYTIPKVLLPVGCQIAPDTLSSGFQAISYNPAGGKPEIMQMPTAPDGIFKAIEKLQQDMETISGVNSVSRGQPEASLKSGSALALVQSMAIQFNAPLQQSYVQLLEDVGTATIQILKEYARTPRMIQIAGRRNKGLIQTSFTGRDIGGISRVQVQAGNPMAKTTSGKLSIAQELLQNGLITTSQEFLSVLETGDLDPLIQGPVNELLNLHSENEVLLDGEQVPVLFTDNHVLHIQEHTSLASDPQIRMDPQRFLVVSQHIQEHIKMLSDPVYQNYRMLVNQPSLPPAQQAPAAGVPGSQQMPQGNTAGMAGVVQPNQPMGAAAVQEKAAGVQMPQMPRNALTGERGPQPQTV
jgi:hypothetical protein